MQMGKAFVKIMCRQCSGIAKRQSKGMPKPNIIWVECMFKGKASVKTMHRQSSGFARRQNKGMPKPNII